MEPSALKKQPTPAWLREIIRQRARLRAIPGEPGPASMADSSNLSNAVAIDRQKAAPVSSEPDWDFWRAVFASLFADGLGGLIRAALRALGL